MDHFVMTCSLGLAATSWIPASLIRNYLKNKPTGLQTLLDKVVLDLTYIMQFSLTMFHLLIFLGLSAG